MLDERIKAVLTKEATLQADAASLANLNSAVAQAQAPVPAAEKLVASDQADLYNALGDLIADAKAAQDALPVPTGPAGA